MCGVHHHPDFFQVGLLFVGRTLGMGEAVRCVASGFVFVLLLSLDGEMGGSRLSACPRLYVCICVLRRIDAEVCTEPLPVTKQPHTGMFNVLRLQH